MNRNTVGSEKDRNWSFKSNLFCMPCVLYRGALVWQLDTALTAITRASDEHVPLCSLQLYCAFYCLYLLVDGCCSEDAAAFSSSRHNYSLSTNPLLPHPRPVSLQRNCSWITCALSLFLLLSPLFPLSFLAAKTCASTDCKCTKALVDFYFKYFSGFFMLLYWRQASVMHVFFQCTAVWNMPLHAHTHSC